MVVHELAHTGSATGTESPFDTLTFDASSILFLLVTNGPKNITNMH